MPVAASPPAVAIVGTTAVGKSALALRIARTVPGVEIVSVDSMQVYRGMDIGTAKATVAERDEVPHHLLDVVEPWEEYSLARFQVDARAALTGIADRGGRAVLVGGTGLYLRAVLDDLQIPGQYPEVREELEIESDTRALHARLRELDPIAAARMEPDNRRRVVRALEVTLGSGRPFSTFGPGLGAHVEVSIPQIGVRLPPPVLARRIGARFGAQLEAGLLDEVDTLLAHDRPPGRTAAQALGYKELIAYRRGEMSLEEAADLAVRRTRRFARRQRVWFARDPRIEWFEAESDPAEIADSLVARATEILGRP